MGVRPRRDGDDAAGQAKRRPLDEFERLGLEAVRRGEELVWTPEAPTRMFGAIRARAKCLRCHVNASEGDLLGAFTYYLSDPTNRRREIVKRDGLKECPNCGTAYPPDTQQCDCGYDFVLRTVEASDPGKRNPHDLTPVVMAIVFAVIVGARAQGLRWTGNKMIVSLATKIALPLAIFAMLLAFR
ncbi:MAG TPA: hypothetical protein VH092_24310 [Urbifossiella sp.]|nr:hypothetical protein [Urbifossiella sp.]